MQQSAALSSFGGKTLAHDPGRSIVVERVLDLAEDLHLADHCLVDVPGSRPATARLPVLPMTMGMEIAAQAAGRLVPDGELAGFHDVRAMRWIALPDTDRLPLRVEATRRHLSGASVVDVMILSGQEKALTAQVRFGPRSSIDSLVPDREFGECLPYPLPARDIYALRHLFHGPTYQCLVGRPQIGLNVARAEFVVRPTDGLFRSTPRPLLLSDPVILDGVGQVVGLWAMNRELYVFPVGVGRLQLCGPRPAVGTRVAVRTRIVSHEGPLLEAQAEVEDGHGRIWIHVDRWTCWVYRWSAHSVDFRRSPTHRTLSHRLHSAAIPPGVVCQTIDASELHDDPMDVLARFHLGPDEMAARRALRGDPDRRREWLMGRIAAKDATRVWCAGGSTELTHPVDLVVTPDDLGRPTIHGPASVGTVPAISISHSGDRAVAVASRAPIGLDLELVAPRSEDFLDTIATREERLLVSARWRGDSSEWVTRLWCAKEAASKLTGRGLDGGPRTFTVSAVGPDGQFEIIDRPTQHRIRVTTARDGAFAVACAVWNTESGEAPSDIEADRVAY